jgi:hydrogenase expression/formation protein HypD
MKYISEYRNPEKARVLADAIRGNAGSRDMTFMEVCGTHTMALARFGIRELLPDSVRLISGPGCPVCVTPNNYLDHAIALARRDDITVLTFGDMVRVPGSSTNLERERAGGHDIRVVYSTLDALELARKSPEREFVFLGVGFETTTPTVAASIISAKKEGLKNYSVLSAHKVVPPALDALLAGPIKLDGFLLPGHVSAIIGAGAYRPILKKSGLAGVVAGFEPLDMLEAINELVVQIAEGRPTLHTSYTRAVHEEPNKRAMAVLHEVFSECDANWRGIGTIPGSGLVIRDEFSDFDAAKRFEVEVEPTVEPKGCICGKILIGEALPNQCPLFGEKCLPENPVGACMVSSEGTCAAYFKYGR